MKIALLEFSDEFEALKRFCQTQDCRLADFTIIAFEPKVQAYLRALGIPYQNTIRYFTSDSHRALMEASERIMNFMRIHFSFADYAGRSECYATEVTHFVRLYVNHLFKLCEIIANLFAVYPGSHFFAYVFYNRCAPVPLITNDERYLGALACEFSALSGVVFTDLNSFGMSLPAPTVLNHRGVPWFVRGITHTLLRLLRGRKVIIIPREESYFKELLKLIGRRERGVIFLCLNTEYSFWRMCNLNIFYALLRLFQRIPFCYFLVNPDLLGYSARPNDLRRIHEELYKTIDSQPSQNYSWQGVQFRQFVRKKVSEAFIPHMNALLSRAVAIDSIFDFIGRPLVMSYVALGLMHVAGETARLRGSRSLFVSHGAHPRPIDSYHEIELRNLCRGFMFSRFTHVAISSPVQEQHLAYFKQRYPWVQNEVFRTGPLVFASIRASVRKKQREARGITEDEFVIVHATTTKARQSERFYILETLDEFFASLRDIVLTVDALSRARLIIRIHPGFFLKDKEIKQLLPVSDRYEIHRSGSFEDALALADILVSYSSTAIDEALINNIPVVLYDRWHRYNHFGTKPFEGRLEQEMLPVCYVYDQLNLAKAFELVRKAIQNGSITEADYSAYRFEQDYSENFYGFIKESLRNKKS